MYLLDTNVVSELRKIGIGRADRQVSVWSAATSASSLFVSVISILELEIGILRLERRDTKQGTVLRRWLNETVLPEFHQRILPIDLAVAVRCAQLNVPDPKPDRDAYLAATALIHGLTMVTRNTADFAGTGVRLLNPWESTRP